MKYIYMLLNRFYEVIIVSYLLVMLMHGSPKIEYLLIALIRKPVRRKQISPRRELTQKETTDYVKSVKRRYFH